MSTDNERRFQVTKCPDEFDMAISLLKRRECFFAVKVLNFDEENIPIEELNSRKEYFLAVVIRILGVSKSRTNQFSIKGDVVCQSLGNSCLYNPPIEGDFHLTKGGVFTITLRE